MNPSVTLIDKDKKVEKIPQSDTFGRIDILEKRFDDALRGAMSTKQNYYQFTDEVGLENIQ